MFTPQDARDAEQQEQGPGSRHMMMRPGQELMHELMKTAEGRSRIEMDDE